MFIYTHLFKHIYLHDIIKCLDIHTIIRLNARLLHTKKIPIVSIFNILTLFKIPIDNII